MPAAGDALVDDERWVSARATKAFIDLKAGSVTDQAVGLLKFVRNDFPKFLMGMMG